MKAVNNNGQYRGIASMKELHDARRRLRSEIEESESALRSYCSSVREELSPLRMAEHFMKRAEIVLTYIQNIKSVYRQVTDMFRTQV